MPATTHRTLFRQLSALLQAHQHLWRPLAFHSTELPWQCELPELEAQLLALSEQEAERLQGDDAQLAQFLRPSLAGAFKLWQLCQLPRAQSRPLAPYPHSFDRDIPGRKWQQVQAFVGAIEQPQLPLLEWCGGKGHLGRSLCVQHRHASADTATAVVAESIDINAYLVDKGQQLSQRFKLPLQHRQADALTDQGWRSLRPQQHALALHACGGLHLELIEQAIKAGTRQLSIAPCCYHLFLGEQSWQAATDCYRPQSSTGQECDLKLAQSDLRTCVQQTVTAPEHDRRLRKKLQAWRLGFDLLQRHVRQVDEYLPVPSLPNRWAATSFVEVCQQLASLKQLSLPEMNSEQWQHWQERGQQRLQQVTALDLVRMAFRRPLELWLVLDRVLKLEEAGYSVQLSEFCQPSLTPRNILIEAQLPQ